jgi:DNA-binding ferritin-like protein
MFEAQYTELAAAVDEIAERIRTLGSGGHGDARGAGSRSGDDRRDCEAGHP